MKNLIALFFTVFTFLTSTFAQNPNHVYVSWHTRSNGTYVEGYYRTAPNSTINDNFSTYPNVNPYTGSQGTISPSYSNTYTNSYSTPTYTTPSYTPYTPSRSITNNNPNYQYTYPVN